MVEEWIIALAASGGTALVAAAATDAWSSTRNGFARLFRRATPTGELLETQLDKTAIEVGRASTPEELGVIRQELLGEWQNRLSHLLQKNPDIAEELQLLTTRVHEQLPEAEQAWARDRSHISAGRDVYMAGRDQTITHNYREQSS